eukprot:UN12076
MFRHYLVLVAAANMQYVDQIVILVIFCRRDPIGSG